MLWRVTAQCSSPRSRISVPRTSGPSDRSKRRARLVDREPFAVARPASSAGPRGQRPPGELPHREIDCRASVSPGISSQRGVRRLSRRAAPQRATSALPSAHRGVYFKPVAPRAGRETTALLRERERQPPSSGRPYRGDCNPPLSSRVSRSSPAAPGRFENLRKVSPLRSLPTRESLLARSEWPRPKKSSSQPPVPPRAPRQITAPSSSVASAKPVLFPRANQPVPGRQLARSTLPWPSRQRLLRRSVTAPCTPAAASELALSSPARPRARSATT